VNKGPVQRICTRALAPNHLESGERVQLLDVRPVADFDGEWGHIPGARSFPLEDLSGRLGELEPDRPVRLVCRTDRRSAQAAAMLAKAGFVDARVIQGGLTAWRARGWPVERAGDDLAIAR
jgi:rhodanese-related sulfurtransferase